MHDRGTTRMSDDPRWQPMSEIAASVTAADGVESASLSQEYVATAEAIAADKTAPAADRVIARQILDTFDRMVRANAPALLAATARARSDRRGGHPRRVQRP